MTPKKKTTKKKKYYRGIGRRKTATAEVRLYKTGKKTITVNDEKMKEYFPRLELQEIIEAPLEKLDLKDEFRISVLVRGSGYHSQAEAVQLGIARALVDYDKELKSALKEDNYLSRDPRMKERKKYGRRKARRSPQWRKR